jgi:hypothetical protein
MLIVRLAARLAMTLRTIDLPAAVVAICSSSATITGAPQVLWAHVHTTGDTPQLTLPASPPPADRDESRIAPRTVALDPWAAEALTDRHAERRVKDKPGEVSNVDPATSIIYAGNQSLDSNSAHAAAAQ